MDEEGERHFMMSSGTRLKLFCVGMVVFSGVLRVEAQSQSELTQRLEKSAIQNSLDGALRPWHMKASFTVEARPGRPADSGTIEEWWAGSIGRKLVYTGRSFSLTEIYTKDGSFRTSGADTAPYLLQLMEQQIVHPLPRPALIESSKLQLTPRKIGDVQLDCISLVSSKAASTGILPSLISTYCFRDESQLLLSYESIVQVVARSQTGTFQGRTVGIQTALSFGGRTAISAHIDLLQGAALTDKDFEPPTGVTKTAEVLSVDPRGNTGDGSVVGAAILQARPRYPPEAKAVHSSGTVLLHAVIGKDGHVRETDVLYSPDETLSKSATDAVRQWVYKPFLVADVPIEVELTIAVNYNIGPAH